MRQLRGWRMATAARTNVAGWSQGEAEPLEGKMAVDTNQEQGQIRMPFLQNQDFSGRWAPSVFPHGASKPYQEELQQLRDVGRTKVSGICFWLVLGLQVCITINGSLFLRYISSSKQAVGTQTEAHTQT